MKINNKGADGAKKACWICGSSTLTKEHKFLHSILKQISHQKKINGSNSIWGFVDPRRIMEIRSTNQDKLKFYPSICSNCNNVLTQHADLCFLHFWSISASKFDKILEDRAVDVQQFYFPDTKESCSKFFLINLQKYILKIFGCSLVMGNFEIPYDIKQFLLGTVDCSNAKIRLAINEDTFKLFVNNSWESITRSPVIKLVNDSESQLSYCWMMQYGAIRFYVEYGIDDSLCNAPELKSDDTFFHFDIQSFVKEIEWRLLEMQSSDECERIICPKIATKALCRYPHVNYESIQNWLV